MSRVLQGLKEEWALTGRAMKILALSVSVMAVLGGIVLGVGIYYSKGRAPLGVSHLGHAPVKRKVTTDDSGWRDDDSWPNVVTRSTLSASTPSPTPPTPSNLPVDNKLISPTASASPSSATESAEPDDGSVTPSSSFVPSPTPTESTLP